MHKKSYKHSAPNILKIILSFLKVGLIGFGGGSALIPVIEKEVVQKTKVISQDEYTKHTIIANITPGTLPTKLGALSTTYTSLLGAYALTVPGVFILIFLLGIISSIGGRAISYIEYASVGISTFIIFLLVEYIIKVMKNGQATRRLLSYISIMLLSFLVTGGKEIRSIISVLINNENDLLVNPIIDIATINLMISAFFVILFLGANITRLKIILASCISIIYVISVGKSSPFPSSWKIPFIINIIMLILIIVSLFKDFKDSNKTKKTEGRIKRTTADKTTKKIIKNIAIFAVIPSLLLVITLLLTINHRPNNDLNVANYAINSIFSTMSSFGGGEAFISIAEGFFVEQGYISANLYYSQVVSIANALPGPILVKVIAAIGFLFGTIQYESSILGIFIATLGTSIAVAVSSIIALIVLLFFDRLKSSPRLRLIQDYILPVVCGMLISTALAMFYESQKIIANHAGNNKVVLGSIFVLVLYFLIDQINRRLKINDLFILLFSAILSLGSFMMFV